jgi:hypothetical protein
MIRYAIAVRIRAVIAKSTATLTFIYDTLPIHARISLADRLEYMIEKASFTVVCGTDFPIAEIVCPRRPSPWLAKGIIVLLASARLLCSRKFHICIGMVAHHVGYPRKILSYPSRLTGFIAGLAFCCWSRLDCVRQVL